MAATDFLCCVAEGGAYVTPLDPGLFEPHVRLLDDHDAFGEHQPGRLSITRVVGGPMRQCRRLGGPPETL